MTRPRGFAPWTPRKATTELLEQVHAVLDEYADFLPLTVRQVFYRLVGTQGHDKTEAAYGRLCEHLNRARRAGMIPFDAIRDDGVSAHRPNAWDGIDDFREGVALSAGRYPLDRQRRANPCAFGFSAKRAAWRPCSHASRIPTGCRL